MTRTLLAALLLALIVGAYVVAMLNYQECRAAGHSMTYCAALHLVR